MRYISFNYSSLDRVRQALLGSYMVNVGLEVIRRAPDNAKPHGRKAAQYVFDISKGRVYRAEIAKAVELAADFAASEPHIVETFKLRPSPDDLIRQGQVLQKLTHFMKVIRKELFGVETGPFSSRKDAQDWMERTAEEEDPRRDPRYELCACGKGVVFHTWQRRKWPTPTRHLKYEGVVVDPGEVTVKSVEVAELRPDRPSKLFQIENHTQKWADATGFDQWSLVHGLRNSAGDFGSLSSLLEDPTFSLPVPVVLSG